MNSETAGVETTDGAIDRFGGMTDECREAENSLIGGRPVTDVFDGYETKRRK